VRGTVKNGCIALGDNALDLSRKLKDIARYEGKALVLGFRPEAIALGAQDGYVVNCRVELTEMLGDNTNVYVTSKDQQVILKVDSHDTPETDADIAFTIPLESVYLFDAETEIVIA